MKKFMILTAILSLNLTLLTGSDAFARQNYQISGENSKNKTVVLGEPLQPGSKSFPQPADSNDDPSEAAPIATGDLNGDGAINQADLSIFLANFPGEATGIFELADFNSNRVLDSTDLVNLLSLMGSDSNQEAATPDGDLNGDGAVDQADLSIFLANFPGEAYGFERADFNFNRVLDSTDLVNLLNLMESDSNQVDFR